MTDLKNFQYLRVQLDTNTRVATLSMNFERENRLSLALMAELHEALDALESDDGAGALVFTGGDPKFFSNGLHLDWLMQKVAEPTAVVDYLQRINNLFHRVTLYPKPTVAALNGHTFAAGAFLAAHMDFRLMREDRGWVCLPEVDINIPLLPGMIAICQAILPPQGFRQLYYTGKRFTAPEAKILGYVDQVCAEADLLPTARSMAALLAQKRTRTYAEMKRRIRGEVARILVEEDPQHFASTLSLAMG
ncbi:MAG: enoyl-CoA hydratase/isomerase family protein [Pseudomonadota bacterium]